MEKVGKFFLRFALSALVSVSGAGARVSHSVSLTWEASTSSVAGYNIYRAKQSEGPYTKINSSLITSTSFTDVNVRAGQTYFYVATAVDESDEESEYSDEVEALVPSP